MRNVETEFVVELADGIQLPTTDVNEAAQYSQAGKRVRARSQGAV